MTSDPRQWSFIADMDYSGSITISDVWLWFKWLYFLPGDGVLYFLIHKTPGVAAFFEVTFSSYGGIFSGIFSFFPWLFFGFGFAIAVLEDSARALMKRRL